MCGQKTIENRDDVERLVHSFYARVRQDELLGPIFNESISEEEWAAHLEKLVDFWETVLFSVPKFKGNPVTAHQKVDEQQSYSIEPKHFGKWIQLWYSTIDSLFTGEKAQRAKDNARKMSTGQ